MAEHPVDAARLISDIGVSVFIGLTTPNLLENYGDKDNYTYWILLLTGLITDVMMITTAGFLDSIPALSGNNFSKNVFRNFMDRWARLTPQDKIILKTLFPNYLNQKGETKADLVAWYKLGRIIVRNCIAPQIVLYGTLTAGHYGQEVLQNALHSLMNMQASVDLDLQATATNTATATKTATATATATFQPTATFTPIPASPTPLPPTPTPISIPEVASARSVVETATEHLKADQLRGYIFNVFKGVASSATLIGLSGAGAVGLNFVGDKITKTTKFAVEQTSSALNASWEVIKKVKGGMDRIGNLAQEKSEWARRKGADFLIGELNTEGFETKIVTGTLTKEEVDNAPISPYFAQFLETKFKLQTKEFAHYELSDIMLDLLLIAVNYYDDGDFLANINGKKAAEILKWRFGATEISKLFRFLTETPDGETMSVGDDLRTAVGKFNELFSQHGRSGEKLSTEMYKKFMQARDNFFNGYYPAPTEPAPDFS